MATNPRQAPLVIAKQKTTHIRFMGQPFSVRDRIVAEMNTQSIADIRWLLKAIAIQDTAIEVRKGNFPSRLIVDGRESTYLGYATRKVEVTFGDLLDMELIKAIERQVTSSVRTNAADQKDAHLGERAYWEWAYALDRNSSATVVADVRSIGPMLPGSFLVYRPRDGGVGLANLAATRKDAGWPQGQWYGPGRSGGRGFMAKALEPLKRTRLMKNYTMRIVFTKRHKVQGELYTHGTPVIILRAKRNTGYRRIRVQ